MADEEFAPALGGDRAQPEPPPPPPPPQAEAPAAEAGEPDIPPELAAFLGPLGRLAELFSESSDGSAPQRRQPTEAEVGGALAEGLEAVLGEALRSFTQRLPSTLAAFEGIVDAVEEVVTPLIGELGNAVREAGVNLQGELNVNGQVTRFGTAEEPAETGTVVDEAGIVDAVPMEEIPPVDLPPNT